MSKMIHYKEEVNIEKNSTYRKNIKFVSDNYNKNRKFKPKEDKHIPAGEIDFALQPITADFLRWHPDKMLILQKYRKWVKVQRKEERRKNKNHFTRIAAFKKRRKILEDKE